MSLSVDEILKQSKKRNLLIESEESKNRLARYKSWLWKQASIATIIFPFRFEEETIINNLDKYIEIERKVVSILKKKRVHLDTIDPEIKYYLFRYCYFTASKKNLHNNIRVWRKNFNIQGSRISDWFKILSKEFAKRFSIDYYREEMMYKDISVDSENVRIKGIRQEWHVIKEDSEKSD